MATLRSKLLRLASALPKDSSERRALVSTLQKAAVDWNGPAYTTALALLSPEAGDIVGFLNKNSKYHWKAQGAGKGSPTSSMASGEGASLSISTKVPPQEGGGWYTFRIGVNGEKDEVVVQLTSPRWQSGGGRPQRVGYGLKWDALKNPAKLFKNQLPGRPVR